MTQTTQQIPAGWKIVALGEIAEVKNGKTNSQDAQEFGDYPLFDRSSEIKRSNKYIFDSDAVIIPGEGAEFVPKFFSGKFDLHQRAYAVYNFQNGIVPKFIYFSINHFKKYFEKVSVGSTVRSLRLPHIIAYPVLLPPHSEQTKIVNILSKLDEEIEKVEKIIERIEKFKRGLIKNLLTKGIGHTKFKKTELGEIPEEWDVVTLKNSDIDIIDGDRGENYPKKNEFMDKGYCLFLSNKNIKNDKFIFDECAFITEEKDKLLRKGKLKRLDIVLTTRGTVGNVAYFDEKIPFENIRLNSGMLIFRAGESFHPGFLYALFKSPLMKNKYMTVASGSAQPQLPIKSLGQIKIPIPPKDEQKNIATILESTDQLLYKTKKQRKNLNKLKKALMTDLLSGKVRVKI